MKIVLRNVSRFLTDCRYRRECPDLVTTLNCRFFPFSFLFIQVAKGLFFNWKVTNRKSKFVTFFYPIALHLLTSHKHLSINNKKNTNHFEISLALSKVPDDVNQLYSKFCLRIMSWFFIRCLGKVDKILFIRILSLECFI